jgi:hypothetical protein
MYGLVDPDGIPMFKPTLLVASDIALLKHLNKLCNKQHPHVHIAGSTRGIPRSRAAQTWPDKLCTAIAIGVGEMLSSNTAYAARPKQKPASLDLAATAMPTQAVPPTATERPVPESASSSAGCIGCRVHARRHDPRHDRSDACRFPSGVQRTWTCKACVAHKRSRSVERSRTFRACQ